MRPLFAWGLMVALAGGALQAQQDTKPYNLEGAVVNARTGGPIPRALVIVQNQEPQPRIALTDESGRFRFEGLRSEPARLRVGKPGFIGAGDYSSELSMEHPEVEVNSLTGSILIRLAPTSAIHGAVASSDGTPLAGVPINLIYDGPMDGRSRLFPRANATTDEDGNYKFHDLLAGRYFIVAGPMSETPLAQAEHSRIPIKHYEQIFYSGVSDPHAATPIEVGSGQDVEAGITLHQVPVFAVSGRVLGWSPKSEGMLRITPLAGPYSPYSDQVTLVAGEFHIPQVPAGRYRINVFTTDNRQAEQELTVDSDIADLKLPLVKAALIPVVLHARDRGSEGASVGITLEPEDKWQQPVSSFTRDRTVGDQILQVPSPGRYRVRFISSPPLHVAAAACGPADLLREPLVVTEDSVPPIELTVAYDSATLEGQVHLSAGVVSAHILILPVDPPGDARMELTSPGGSFGRFVLAPGTYRVWAFDRAPRYFRESQAMEPYSSQAHLVTLAPNQTVHIELDVLKGGEDE